MRHLEALTGEKLTKGLVAIGITVANATVVYFARVRLLQSFFCRITHFESFIIGVSQSTSFRASFFSIICDSQMLILTSPSLQVSAYSVLTSRVVINIRDVAQGSKDVGLHYLFEETLTTDFPIRFRAESEYDEPDVVLTLQEIPGPSREATAV